MKSCLCNRNKQAGAIVEYTSNHKENIANRKAKYLNAIMVNDNKCV